MASDVMIFDNRWLRVFLAALLAASMSKFLVSLINRKLSGLSSMLIASTFASLVGNSLFPPIALSSPDAWVFIALGSAVGGVYWISADQLSGNRDCHYYDGIPVVLLISGTVMGFFCGVLVNHPFSIIFYGVLGFFCGFLLSVPCWVFKYSCAIRQSKLHEQPVGTSEKKTG